MVILFTLDENSRIADYKLSVHLEWVSNISSQCSRLLNEKKHFVSENAISNQSTINFCKSILQVFIQSCDVINDNIAALYEYLQNLKLALNVKVYFKLVVSLTKMLFEKHPTIHQAGYFLIPDSFCYGTSSSTEFRISKQQSSILQVIVSG